MLIVASPQTSFRVRSSRIRYANWKMGIAVRDSLVEWKRNIYNNKNSSTQVQVLYEEIRHWLKAPAKFTF